MRGTPRRTAQSFAQKRSSQPFIAGFVANSCPVPTHREEPMTNDAKLGMLAGVLGVILAAVFLAKPAQPVAAESQTKQAPAPTAMQSSAVKAITGWMWPGATARPVSAVKITSDMTRGFKRR